MSLILSPKYKAFLKCSALVEFLEGTTAAGKTTVGAFKFILKCAESPKKIHILSGLDLGTIEKNIINKELGILDNFGELTEYNANGKGQYSLPHIVLHTSGGDKIIYVLGYDNKARWKKALGGQYGCLYIDEINIADMDYVREASMRCDYLLATLNPDDPNLPVYTEYINCSRPLPEWCGETPAEILNMLNEEPKADWVHWFFSFEHNFGLPPEKIEQIKRSVPKGTKLYKNKILGLRGRATGLVFSNFSRPEHTRTKVWAHKLKFEYFSAGLDTAYSQQSPDTIAMSFIGITKEGVCVLLDERVCNNAQLQTPLAPSDTAASFVDFLERNRTEWGLARNTFVDSADQATITELNKYRRTHGSVYIFNNAWKKVTIIDRINMQLGWLAHDKFFVLDHCRSYINELEIYSWREDKLDALIEATTHDMETAETAVLRMANDRYRSVIFNAQVYANTGAGTYEQAIDMATKDFLSAGINCIEYKNGRRVNIRSYAEMALRTASKRAYLQGEGEKRKEWGIHTVILNKRTNPCPKCAPFVGKVFIDDVYSGGSKDGISNVTGIKYPLLSEAIAKGLYHPNCKDSHTTYFEGVSTPPEGSEYTKEQLDELADKYYLEQKAKQAENQAKRLERMSKYSLDSENKRVYGYRAKQWESKARQLKSEINGVAIGAVSGIIEADEMFRSKDRTRIDIKAISDERFKQLTIEAQKNGAVILRGNEEIEKHLDMVGADAATLGDVLLFRSQTCVSEVLEETHHFFQNLRGMNADKQEPLRSILNEIDAKEYLLENAQKYNIPRSETETTKKQLDNYREQLRKMQEGKYE